MPRWRIVERWELHAGTHVDLGKSLEKFGRTPFHDARRAVDDEVVRHADRIGAGGLDTTRDAWVSHQVLDFSPAH